MGFIIEQECPQCGAPLELDEADRILLCQYCGVKNYLYTPGHFRYILPDNAPDREIIYAPYLRFKGKVFYLKGMETGHRIIDITQAGLEMGGLPMSLGLRPQAMKLKFAVPDPRLSFMRFTLKASDILTRAARLSSGKGSILHRAFIGETMSIVYLPLYIHKGKLYDAILNRSLPGYLPAEEGPETQPVKIHKTMDFLPTLCPECGWNLNGERESVVLICENCETAWEAVENRFVKVKTSIVKSSNGQSIYLPFWKITADVDGIEIKSFADFIRVTGQSRVLRNEWEDEEMSFWCPAFRIRPGVFLNLSRQFTVLQKHFPEAGDFPFSRLFPASLPCSEAVQALKMILAASAVMKNRVLPRIGETKFKVKEHTLVYMPFRKTHHEMIHEHTGLSINSRTLEYGRRL